MSYGSLGLDASGFKNVSGVCKPMDFAALAKFKELQSQCNRVAQVKGYSKVKVDGDIGRGTVELVERILGIRIYATGKDCGFVAANVENLTSSIKHVADTWKAPTTVSPPISSTGGGSITTPVGQIAPPPDAGTPADPYGASAIPGFGQMSTGMKIAAGAGLVGIAVLAGRELKKGKGGGRRSRSSRRRRR